LSFSRIYVTIFLISNIDNKSGNIFAFLTNLVNSWKDNLPPVDITCLDYNVLNFDLFEINNCSVSSISSFCYFFDNDSSVIGCLPYVYLDSKLDIF
jgi:hypothetical protein